ncbi:MAG: NADH-quinone oxidoreductase subunit L [Actinomycetia bacterium]|nr:NADH-quinone oxidoreductase subunit L [Actinomycetes bacterium]MCP3912473.1 NADH-quinone oxidoreductase subunit L [Actinomycetes bacterium]
MLLAAQEAAAPSAPWILDNIWVIPALPTLSFLLILFFGKKMPFKGAEFGLATVGVAFVLACVAAVSWIGYEPDVAHVDGSEDTDTHAEEEGDHEEGLILPASASGEQALPATDAPEGEGGEEGHHASPEPVVNTIDWWSNGGVQFTVGTMVDGLSVMMLFVVSLISLLVHVYSTDYVHDDVRYTHFFAFLSLFTASMLFFVVSANTLQMIVGWELVGVCSFALIGHWWEEKPNSDAALKAFLTNRVGDMGLLIGMIVLFFASGETFSIIEINSLANAGVTSHNMLLLASVCLMAAVMSKSGQFALHTWLPDAMAGPTPVSALIHAATMVVAGVYLIARLYGVFFEGLSIAGSSINLMAMIGATTVIIGGLLAFVQNDIKKVLAYSTISQLGYMVLALGMGAWTAAMFHLFTHAFFKACLFLGSGSVSHAVHHSFDMKKDMGGLRKYMPHTFATFMIGSVALAGIPPLAGFWSKDEILVGAGSWPGTDGNGNYHLMLIMGMAGAALTAAYMTRCVYLTFFGEYRGHGTPHESGPRIIIPLWILAAFAFFAGLLNLPKGVAKLVDEDLALQFEHWFEPTGVAYFPEIAHAHPSLTLAAVSSLIALGGGVVAWVYYFKRVDALEGSQTELPNGLTTTIPPLRAGHTFLVNKYYLDHLYTDVIAAGTKGPVAQMANTFNQKVLDGVVDGAAKTAVAVGQGVYDHIDQGVVDRAINASGAGSSEAGGVLRRIQSGKIQQYATLMFGAAVVLAVVLVVAL